MQVIGQFLDGLIEGSLKGYVRKEALYLLQNALEGCGGLAAAATYTEAFQLIMQFGVNHKAPIVRIATARCLKAFANAGGPSLGVVELALQPVCVSRFNLREKDSFLRQRN